MQVTWHLLVMFFWETYEIFRTGFTRNICECQLLELVITGKCLNQNIFLKKYLIWFDIQWHVLWGIKCITDVWWPFMMFILVHTWFVWFTSLHAWTSSNVTSIVSITHTVIFSKQEVSRRRVARGSPEKINVRETVGRKNNCKLNFFSIYFTWTNKEIHLSFCHHQTKDCQKQHSWIPLLIPHASKGTPCMEHAYLKFKWLVNLYPQPLKLAKYLNVLEPNS